MDNAILQKYESIPTSLFDEPSDILFVKDNANESNENKFDSM